MIHHADATIDVSDLDVDVDDDLEDKPIYSVLNMYEYHHIA